MIKKLALALIRQDGGTQPRISRNAEWCEDYAHDMADGRWDWARPGAPLTVFYDGASYWLADGFHRRDAAEIAHLDKVPCDVHQGTQRDAQLFSCGVNAVHGHRRTNDDKRRAVTFMLADEEWAQWSDREIARRCNVDHAFVGKLRASLATVTSEPSPKRSYTTKHGTQATMDTSKIGKGKNAGKRKPHGKQPTQRDEPDAEPTESYERVKPDDPIDDCLASVRYTVLTSSRDIAVSDWPELIVKLRDELDDIEKVLNRRSADGGLHAPH